MADVQSRPRTVASLLSFAAGYVDTVGFVALFGLFTAHVTGNFVLIGASLTRPSPGVIAKLAALPVFFVAVVLTTVFVRMRLRANRGALRGVLLAQIVFLGSFAAVGMAAAPFTSSDAPLAILAGLLGVFGMGIQNAASRLLMAELPPTTVMTGGVTQVAVDTTLILLGQDRDAAARGRIGKFLPPVVSFAIGAVAGAVAYSRIGFAALLAPMAALLLVVLLSRPNLPPGSAP
jgi:uncharacterized membrane protein YoaK (UPF0700 family)